MNWNKIGNTLIRYRYAFSLIGTACYSTYAINPFKIYLYEKDKKHITPEIKNLINQVISEFNLDQSLMKNMLFRFDNHLYPSTLGFYRMPFGQVMLLPEYFYFTSTSELTDDFIKSYLQKFYKVYPSMRKQMLNNHFINEFKESLILTPKAKKFIIAQQFSMFKTKYFIIKALIEFFALSFSLEVMRYILKIAPNAPFLYIAKFFILVFLLLIGYINVSNYYQDLNSIAFALTKDKLNHSDLIFMAKNNNFSLIDDDYYQGALDYFENLAKRNKAARNIALNESFFSLKRFTISPEGIYNYISFDYNIKRMKEIKILSKMQEIYDLFDEE